MLSPDVLLEDENVRTGVGVGVWGWDDWVIEGVDDDDDDDYDVGFKNVGFDDDDDEEEEEEDEDDKDDDGTGFGYIGKFDGWGIEGNEGNCGVIVVVVVVFGDEGLFPFTFPLPLAVLAILELAPVVLVLELPPLLLLTVVLILFWASAKAFWKAALGSIVITEPGLLGSLICTIWFVGAGCTLPFVLVLLFGLPLP